MSRSSSTDLCGGRLATAVPTAILENLRWTLASDELEKREGFKECMDVTGRPTEFQFNRVAMGVPRSVIGIGRSPLYRFF